MSHIKRSFKEEMMNLEEEIKELILKCSFTENKSKKVVKKLAKKLMKKQKQFVFTKRIINVY